MSRSSPACRLLAPGSDVITDVLFPARRKVHSAAELQQVLGALKTGDVVSLRVFGTAEPLIGVRVVNLRIGE